MEPEKLYEQWQDSSERFGAAVRLFEIYLKQARELEKELDSMLDAHGRIPERDAVNKKLDAYAVLMSKITTIDEELDSLYNRCVLLLDVAFKTTAELRLPRLMMAFSNAKKELAFSLYDTR